LGAIQSPNITAEAYGLSLCMAVWAVMEPTTERLEPRLTGYADVNGLRMYYELYGGGHHWSCRTAAC
jgi:hypothetical protein